MFLIFWLIGRKIKDNLSNFENVNNFNNHILFMNILFDGAAFDQFRNQKP